MNSLDDFLDSYLPSIFICDIIINQPELAKGFVIMGGKHRTSDSYDPDRMSAEELEKLRQALLDEDDFPSKSGDLNGD